MTRRGEDFVYLDVRHKDPEQTRRHFPNIYENASRSASTSPAT